MKNKNQPTSIDKGLIIATFICAMFCALLGYLKFGHVDGAQNSPVISIVFFFCCGLLILFTYAIISGCIKSIEAKKAITKGIKSRATFVKATIASRTGNDDSNDKYYVTLRFTNDHGISKEKQIAGLFTLPMVKYLKSQNIIDVYVYGNNCALDEKYFNMNVYDTPYNNFTKYNSNVIEYNGDNAENENNGKIENKLDDLTDKTIDILDKIGNSKIVQIGYKSYRIIGIIIACMAIITLLTILGIQAYKSHSPIILTAAIPFTVVGIFAIILQLKHNKNHENPTSKSKQTQKGTPSSGKNVRKDIETFGLESKYYITFSYYNDINGSKTIKQEVPKMIYDQVIDGGTIPIRIYKGNANIDIAYFYNKNQTK